MEDCLLIGGFIEFGEDLCHSVFISTKVNDHIELKPKSNGNIKLFKNEHVVKCYRAMIVFSKKNKKCKLIKDIKIDNYQRRVRVGTIILNINDQLVFIDPVKPIKDYKCFLYRFIRSHKTSTSDFDTYSITDITKTCQPSYTFPSQVVSLSMTSSDSIYKFNKWYVTDINNASIDPYQLCLGYNNNNVFLLTVCAPSNCSPVNYTYYFIGYLCSNDGVTYFVNQQVNMPITQTIYVNNPSATIFS